MALDIKPVVSRMATMLRDNISGSFTGQYEGKTVNYHIGAVGSESDPKHQSCDLMWRAQPNLRTVVDFYARNISQLRLHLYKRGDTGSERVRDHAVANLMRKPNAAMAGSDFLYALVADFSLYDEAFVWVRPADNEAGYVLEVIPSSWVQRQVTNALDQPESYTISWGDNTRPTVIPGDQIIQFKGWTPGDPTRGTSPVHTLRLILEERHAAQKYRNQVWRKSGRLGGTFTRPADAAAWSDGARRRFMRMVNDFTGNNGSRAGEDMLLEDGIKYDRVALVAKEEQFVESAKLSLETVAQVYQINPTMIGMLDNANFSNVREFRRSMYGETLGPVLTRIEDRLNNFLLPMLGVGDEFYLEFNVEAKLRGSFEEQAGVVSTATGAPWQTRNEARRLFNLPDIEGGDEIITPLNVLIGGQASSRDGGANSTQFPGAAPANGEDEEDEEDGEKSVAPEVTEAVLLKFLEHQRQSVNSRVGAGRKDWWEGTRWAKELSSDLVAAGHTKTESYAMSKKVNAQVQEAYLKSGLIALSLPDLVGLLDS